MAHERSAEGVRQFVTFYLGEGLYGLDIRTIKEINPTSLITPVPRSSPAVSGLVNIRGQVILVIDIAVTLGLEPQPPSELSHLIIFKTAGELATVPFIGESIDTAIFGGKPIGFLADRIAEVITIEAAAIETAPVRTTKNERHQYDGVVKLERESLVIISPDELIRSSAG